MKIKRLISAVKRRIRGGYYSIDEMRDRGVTIGENCHLYTNMLDFEHGYLIFIGNNVTFASGVRVLTHDASTKMILGYSKVGRVNIGDNVFVGAGSIILPGVTIGNHVIIGAGSIISKDIPSNTVAVGNPCKVIGTYSDFCKKNEKLLQNTIVQKSSFNVKTNAEKQEMVAALGETRFGFDD